MLFHMEYKLFKEKKFLSFLWLAHFLSVRHELDDDDDSDYKHTIIEFLKMALLN